MEIVEHRDSDSKPSPALWTEDKVFEGLKDILLDVLGVESEEIERESSLVADLGAESIDFLDLAYQMDQVFGVALPTRQLAEHSRAFESDAIDAVVSTVSSKYHVTVSENEKAGLKGVGIRRIVQSLGKAKNFSVTEDEIRNISSGIIQTILDQLSRFKIEASETKHDEMVDAFLEDLSPTNVGGKIGELFTVQSLINFVMNNLPAA